MDDISSQQVEKGGEEQSQEVSQKVTSPPQQVPSRSSSFNKRTIALIAVLVFVVAGVSLFLLSTGYFKSASEKEETAIMRGFVRLIGGTVTTIYSEENRFDIDMDPLGPESKIYSIYTDANTEFYKEDYFYETKQSNIPQSQDFEEDGAEDQFLEEGLESVVFTPLVFSDIKENMRADVYLTERVDLEQAKRLQAVRVRLSN